MLNKKIVKGLLLLLTIVLLIAWYAWSEYNRKTVNLANTTADYHLTAPEIILDFQTDQKKNNTKYLTKVLVVTGNIHSIDSSNKYRFSITLSATNSTTSIICSLDSLVNFNGLDLKKGSPITIKGVYTGYNSDEMGIGADILMNKCMILNNKQ